VCYVDADENTTRYPDGKPENIYKGIQLVLKEISYSNLEIIPKHKALFKVYRF
jgi:hypothetical protein